MAMSLRLTADAGSLREVDGRTSIFARFVCEIRNQIIINIFRNLLVSMTAILLAFYILSI